MEQGNVKERLTAALGGLCARDGHLLCVGAHERAIIHRLGMYLQDQFCGWHVDCEYNRHGHDPKTLQLNECEFDRESSVYPDIIVHKRGPEGPNLLVIEVKKDPYINGEGVQRDLRKLDAYKKRLSYTYAVFLKVWTGANRRDPEWRWC